jgi:hypothetical protein
MPPSTPQRPRWEITQTQQHRNLFKLGNTPGSSTWWNNFLRYAATLFLFHFLNQLDEKINFINYPSSPVKIIKDGLTPTNALTETKQNTQLIY